MKTMKTKIKLGLLGLTLTSMTFAGGGSSGGGGSFVCRDLQTTNILSAVSQDLWEASRKQKIITSDLSEENLSYEILSKLPEAHSRFREKIRKALEVVLLNRSIENVKIVPLGDSKHDYEVGSCAEGVPSFEVAAKYKVEELVYSKAVWEKMDDVSKAALNVHEAIYKVLRDEYQEKDSLRTRKIVGFLFSDMNYENVKNDIPLNKVNPYGFESYEQKYYELYHMYMNGRGTIVADFLQNYSSCYYFSYSKSKADRKMVELKIAKQTMTTRRPRFWNPSSLEIFFTFENKKDFFPLMSADADIEYALTDKTSPITSSIYGNEDSQVNDWVVNFFATSQYNDLIAARFRKKVFQGFIYCPSK